jgi:hypothetical protein
LGKFIAKKHRKIHSPHGTPQKTFSARWHRIARSFATSIADIAAPLGSDPLLPS